MEHKCDWACLKKFNGSGYPEECKAYEKLLVEKIFGVEKKVCDLALHSCIDTQGRCCGSFGLKHLKKHKNVYKSSKKGQKAD